MSDVSEHDDGETSNERCESSSTRMTLSAERLSARITSRTDRIARITRRVVKETRRFEIELLHEELVVTYEEAGESQVTAENVETAPHVIELRAEEIEISKSVRVVEEILVSVAPRVEIRRFEETVRHEELEVDRSGGESDDA